MKVCNVLLIAIFSFCSAGTQTVVADLNDGLVAFYPFNGNAHDSSSSNNNCAVLGANLTTDRFGIENSAYYFDGDSYMDCGNDASVQISGTGITVSVWIYISNYPVEQKYIVSKWDPGYSWIVFLQPDGTVGFELFAGEYFKSPESISLNEWTHIVGTYNGDLHKVYINGEEVASKNENRLISESSANLIIGRHHLHGGNRFVGELDNLRIYNRGLSGYDIQQLYQSIAKPQIAVEGGYIKLDITGGEQPLNVDCSDSIHEGRMVLDNVNGRIYVCTQSGWLSK